MLPPIKSNSGKYRNKVGTYYPLNKDKYVGAYLPIFKSDLERRMMRYLDENPNVLKWIYEPRAIQYRDLSKLDKNGRPGKLRKYYIDFVATINTGNNEVKTVWIEVKSYKETIPPKDTASKLDKETWIRNSCKWQTAKQLCEANGNAFVVITDKELS